MASARYSAASLTPNGSRPFEARNTAYLAIAVGLLSAISVFFLLFERDHSFLRQVSLYDAATYIAHTGPLAPASAASTTDATQPRQASVDTMGGYIPFEIVRSKHFQPVGPISVGIWKTDAKHGTYDIGIMVEGQRFDKRRVGLDEALAIRIGNDPPLQLVVNRVFKNEVSGYLSTTGQGSPR